MHINTDKTQAQHMLTKVAQMASMRLALIRVPALKSLPKTCPKIYQNPVWVHQRLLSLRGPARIFQSLPGPAGTHRNVSYVSNFIKLKPRTSHYVTIGISFACLTSAFIAIEYYYTQNRAKFRPKNDIPAAAVISTSIPSILPSRTVSGPTKLSRKFTLYQYQTCPFCCKVRAFMDYYGIPYDVVEVNPVLRQQIKFSQYKKVPILVTQTDGSQEIMQMNDSSTIISALASYLMTRDPKSRHHNETLESIMPWYQNVKVIREDGAEVNEVINKYFLMFGDIEERKYKKIENMLAEERNWRRWADDVLVHTLSPNIYRTMDESLAAFRYFSQVGEWEKHFPAWERNLVIYVGATAMYFVARKLKKKHMLKDDVRLSLYDACHHWVKSLGPERKFMGGDKPNLADLAVFGVLNSIEGCDAFKDLLQNTKIGPWYFSVKETCKNHSGHHQFNYLQNATKI